MANKIVFTDVFRLSYPHLEKPQEPQKAGDVPKFGIAMMYPQTGILPVNNQPSTPNSIFAALDEVCMETWNINFAQASAVGMGVQFPPVLKDGNSVFEKDANGNPIAGQVQPNSANMNILTCKSVDPVGCVDPTGTKIIAPKELLAGYWCSAELECCAYENSNKQRVISIQLLNIQLCYKDETFGAKRVAQAANVSFANRAVQDTNISAGSIPQVIDSQPIASTVPSIPPAPAPQIAPPAPQIAPPAPPAPPAPTNADPVIMNAGEADYNTYKTSGWTDQQIIDSGKGKANYLNPAS